MFSVVLHERTIFALVSIVSIITAFQQEVLNRWADFEINCYSVVIPGDTWSTRYSIPKNDRFSNSPTNWT